MIVFANERCTLDSMPGRGLSLTSITDVGVRTRDQLDEFPIGLVLGQLGRQLFHGIHGIHAGQHPAEDRNGPQHIRRQELFLTPRARLGNINRRPDTAVRQPAIEDQLHVARAFEFLKDQFVHAATRVDQGRGHNGQ